MDVKKMAKLFGRYMQSDPYRIDTAFGIHVLCCTRSPLRRIRTCISPYKQDIKTATLRLLNRFLPIHLLD